MTNFEPSSSIHPPLDRRPVNKIATLKLYKNDAGPIIHFSRDLIPTVGSTIKRFPSNARINCTSQTANCKQRPRDDPFNETANLSLLTAK